LATVATSLLKVPSNPLGDRQTSNPVSLVELSCQDTAIRLSDVATALVLDGAFTAGAVASAEQRNEQCGNTRGKRGADS